MAMLTVATKLAARQAIPSDESVWLPIRTRTAISGDNDCIVTRAQEIIDRSIQQRRGCASIGLRHRRQPHYLDGDGDELFQAVTTVWFQISDLCVGKLQHQPGPGDLEVGVVELEGAGESGMNRIYEKRA